MFSWSKHAFRDVSRPIAAHSLEKGGKSNSKELCRPEGLLASNFFPFRQCGYYILVVAEKTFQYGFTGNCLTEILDSIYVPGALEK